MILQSFRSVLWVGGVGVAALSCYMVSLSVAAERAQLEKVEGRILLAEREIRGLETELGTRGRLTQLERWNVEVLALAAPGEGQFVNGTVQLANLIQPKPVADPEAPVRMASAENPPERRAERVVMAEADADDAAGAPRKPRIIQASADAPARGLAAIRADVAAAAEAERPDPEADAR